MNKIFYLIISLTLMTCAAQASVTITYVNDIDGPNGATWEYTVTNTAGTPSLIAATADSPPVSGTFTSTISSESFIISVDAWAPTFDPVTFVSSGSLDQIKSNNEGAGVQFGSNDLNPNEAIVYTFDLTGLDSGNQLTIVGAVYEFASGVIYADNGTGVPIGSGQNIDFSSSPIVINDGDSLAFMTTSANRLTSVELDITAIPEPSSFALLGGLLGLSLTLLHRRKKQA